MPFGRFWGSLFFVFMSFAALSTVIAVFENIVSYCMDVWGWTRKKASTVNCVTMFLLSLPCTLGFNVLSGFHQQDEARARAQMQAEERKADRPNIIKGTLPPTGTWRPVTALLNRGLGRWR